MESEVRETKAAQDARNLLLGEYYGILSSHSQDVPGYPFGSVMPYCLDKQGDLIILISDLAQHTKNIDADPKVSLIISQRGVDDIHKAARLTWIGDATKIERDSDELAEIEQRYYSFFPPAADYHKTHGFDFYRITLKRARYIGGFGKIFWVKNELLKQENPFFGKAEKHMVSHMNEEHTDAIEKYCRLFDIDVPNGVEPKIAGIDASGMHLLLKDRLVRIPFAEEVGDPTAARNTLIAMARQES